MTYGKKNENTTSKKTQNIRIKLGSSHPYTQRQLVLERKLKTTCPQVRNFTPETTQLGYNRGMQIVTGSENQRFNHLQLIHQIGEIQSSPRESYRTSNLAYEKYKCTEHTSLFIRSGIDSPQSRVEIILDLKF